jgi:hypothetical protein
MAEIEEGVGAGSGKPQADHKLDQRWHVMRSKISEMAYTQKLALDVWDQLVKDGFGSKNLLQMYQIDCQDSSQPINDQ